MEPLVVIDGVQPQVVVAHEFECDNNKRKAARLQRVRIKYLRSTRSYLNSILAQSKTRFKRGHDMIHE